MKTIKVTVAEYQKLSGMKNAVEAGSVINFLSSQGLAQNVGQKRRSDGKGKPANIWEIPQTATVTLFEDAALPALTVNSEKDETQTETVTLEAEETQEV